MPNVSPQVLAQILRSQAGAAYTPAEANSFLAAQPTPSMDYMRQTTGAAMTPAEMARMQAQQMQMQSGAAITPAEMQQLQMMQGR
jgi:hypothetical protein